jgi:DNA repair protein REV1
VDCVKAGKALPWNQYRLIDNSSQKTIGFTPNSVASYKAVSSRDEKVMHGGSGLQLTPVKNEPSQESSSYPTPPELKSMDLDNIEHNVKSEQPENTSPLTQNRNLGGKKEFQLPSTLSPPKEEDTEVFVEDDLPNTLSPLEIFSGPSKGFQHTHQQSPLPRSRYPMPEAAQSLKEPPATLMEPENEPRTPPAQPNDLGLPSTLSPIQISSPLVRPSEPAPTTPLKPRNNTEPADQAAAHNAAILANPSLRPHTVVHPDFLKSYFDQSRLHYLSTWKADLKNQMQQLASLKPKRPRTSGRRMILHVDFDCFFCSVSLVARPELKDKPVCVGHGGAKSGEIASCNYVARNFGVHNGMR